MELEFENFVDLKSTHPCSASTPLLLFFKLNSEAMTDSQVVVRNNINRSHTSSPRPPISNISPNDSVKSQEADPDPVTGLSQAPQCYMLEWKCVSVDFTTCRSVWPPPPSRHRTVHHKRPLWDPSTSTVTPLPSLLNSQQHNSAPHLHKSVASRMHYEWNHTGYHVLKLAFFSIMLLWPI